MELSKEAIKKALRNLGFSPKEANVYLALLELGRSTVSEIARHANINRTTGYDILDNLVNRGLVSLTGKKPRQEYVAESPDRLEKLYKEAIEKNADYLKTATELIPQLKSIHNVSGRPRVRFYEGTDGLMEVYEDTLTSHEPIRAYATVDDMYRALPGYFPKYFKRRTAKGISIRAIVPRTQIGMELAARNREEARETALIPFDRFHFSPEINVYDTKVMIASWREKLGIIIESAEIADAMKKIYELAWAEAKRLDRATGETEAR